MYFPKLVYCTCVTKKIIFCKASVHLIWKTHLNKPIKIFPMKNHAGLFILFHSFHSVLFQWGLCVFIVSLLKIKNNESSRSQRLLLIHISFITVVMNQLSLQGTSDMEQVNNIFFFILVLINNIYLLSNAAPSGLVGSYCLMLNFPSNSEKLHDKVSHVCGVASHY